MPTIEAVTFDFWNTLVTEDPTVLERRRSGWSSVLAELGVERSDDELGEAFREGWEAYVAAWHDNRSFDAADAVEVMTQHLGLADLPGGVREQLLSIFTDPPADRFPRLTANVAGCLRALHDSGIRIGIVCDVGLTPSRVLRRYLDQQGVLDCFDHWSFSDEVGVFKPDPRIFRHALEGLGGPPPDRTAHVGDLRRTDVAGARRMGMLSVRYTGVSDDPPPDGGPAVEADHVVADHAELPLTLGLA